jgi:hypothetical protein
MLSIVFSLFFTILLQLLCLPPILKSTLIKTELFKIEIRMQNKAKNIQSFGRLSKEEQINYIYDRIFQKHKRLTLDILLRYASNTNVSAKMIQMKFDSFRTNSLSKQQFKQLIEKLGFNQKQLENMYQEFILEEKVFQLL